MADLIEFTPAIKPGVEIEQEIVNPGAIDIPTSPLPAVVIGVLNKFVTDQKVVDYVKTTSPVDHVLPDYEAASKIYMDSVKVIAKNIEYDIVSNTDSLDITTVDSGTGDIIGVSFNQLEDTGADFSSGGSDVQPQDVVEISHVSLTNPVVAYVTNVTGTILTINVNFPSGLTGVTYSIKRASGYVSLGSLDILKDDTTNKFQNVKPGDKVVVMDPVYNQINCEVIKVINANQIQLDKSLPVGTNKKFEITRSNATSLTILTSQSGVFNPDIGATTTDVLTNNSVSTNYTDVKAGDKVVIVSGNQIDEATVLAKIDSQNIQLSKQFSGGVVSVSVNRVTKLNAEQTLALTTHYTLDDSDEDGFLDLPKIRVVGNLTIASQLVKKCEINVTFKFISRKDANIVLELTVDNKDDLVGEYDPLNNPLGTGATLAIANTSTKVFAIPVEEDSLDGWLAALSTAESKDLYNCSLMTSNPTYQGLLRSHIDGQSTALKHNWRVGWQHLPHPYEGVTTPKKKGGTIQFKDEGGSNPDTIVVYDPLTDFSKSRVGGFIEITFEDNTSQKHTKFLKIKEKVSNTLLHCENFTYSAPTGMESGKGAYLKDSTAITNVSIDGVTVNNFESSPMQVEYKVFYILSKTEQAQTLANFAYIIGRRRINLITNETCVLDVNGEGVEAPGFYLCAAYAGLSSGTPPHQPLTNFPLNGVLGVRKGNEFFDSDQQGIIVKGGGWLVIQNVLDDGAPYAWKQTTTDTSSVKAIEFSFTKNFDEITKALYVALRGYPGNHNLVPAAISDVNSQTVAVLESRSNNDTTGPRGGRLGPQILSYSFSGHTPDPIIPDLTYADIEAVLPITWNRIKVRFRA